MRALTISIAVSLSTVVAVPGAKAQECTLATMIGTYAFSALHYEVEGTPAKPIYSPRASSGVLFYDGNGNMQYESISSDGIKPPEKFTGAGTYTIEPVVNPFLHGTATMCHVIVTITTGETQLPQNYYLSTSGDHYYGISTTHTGQVRSVKADRVSRPTS